MLDPRVRGFRILDPRVTGLQKAAVHEFTLASPEGNEKVSSLKMPAVSEIACDNVMMRRLENFVTMTQILRQWPSISGNACDNATIERFWNNSPFFVTMRQWPSISENAWDNVMMRRCKILRQWPFFVTMAIYL